MEAAILLGLLGYGVHQYLGHDDESKQSPQAVYSSQTTEEIANFGDAQISPIKMFRLRRF